MTRTAPLLWSNGVAIAALVACGTNPPGGGSPSDAGTTADGHANPTTNTDAGPNAEGTAGGSHSPDPETTAGEADALDSTTADLTTGDGDADHGASSGTGSPGATVYAEDFSGANGAPWPAPWMPAGTAILASDLSEGRGRMAGQTTTVGRMIAPGFDEVDVDAAVTVTFDNVDAQGFGFYVRQNGGALQRTAPPGEGYAVFVEGNGQPAIGVWRETNGVEELLAEATRPLEAGAESGLAYRIRFSCRQAGNETLLRAKIWRAGEAEPADWQLEHADPTPQLQNVGGSFAVDIYNYAGQGSIYVDDIVVERLL